MSYSCESLVNGYGRNLAAEEKDSQSCYFNSCCCFMMCICLILGFIAGGIVGVYLEKNGDFDELRNVLKGLQLKKQEEKLSDTKCIVKSVSVSDRDRRRDCSICSANR